MSYRLQVHSVGNQLVADSSQLVADVKSPPLRPTLLTSLGTEWYICNANNGRPHPSLPQGEGVDSAAELDTPDPAIVEAGTTSKGEAKGINHKS